MWRDWKNCQDHGNDFKHWKRYVEHDLQVDGALGIVCASYIQSSCILVSNWWCQYCNIAQILCFMLGQPRLMLDQFHVNRSGSLSSLKLFIIYALGMLQQCIGRQWFWKKACNSLNAQRIATKNYWTKTFYELAQNEHRVVVLLHNRSVRDTMSLSTTNPTLFPTPRKHE